MQLSALDIAQLLAFPGVGNYFLSQFSVAQLHILRRVCKAFDRCCSGELAAMPGPLALGGYYPGAANASHMNGLMPRKALTEQLDLLTMRWRAPEPAVPSPPGHLAHATVVALTDGSLIVVGGEGNDGACKCISASWLALGQL